MGKKRWLFDASTILVAVIAAEIVVIYLQRRGMVPVPSNASDGGCECYEGEQY